jgi:N6-L-threonylcarbamoyladenine synthase
MSTCSTRLSSRPAPWAGPRLSDVDAVAVTVGPGLAGSLLVGVAAAKAYALALDRPLSEVNHLVAHVYANVLDHGPLPLPAVVFVVSGGTPACWPWTSRGRSGAWARPSTDAAGEAYDKVARVLGLGYPGGPVVDRLARDGDPAAGPVPKGPAGRRLRRLLVLRLKTAVLRHVRAAGPDLNVADVAASFQEAVVDVQISKVVGVAKREGLDTVLLGGGVAANSRLRARLAAEADASASPARPLPGPVHRQRRHGGLRRQLRPGAGRAHPPGRRRRPQPPHHPGLRPPRRPAVPRRRIGTVTGDRLRFLGCG